MVLWEALDVEDCAFEGELVGSGGGFHYFCLQITYWFYAVAQEESVCRVLLGMEAELALWGIQYVHLVQLLVRQACVS